MILAQMESVDVADYTTHHQEHWTALTVVVYCVLDGEWYQFYQEISEN